MNAQALVLSLILTLTPLAVSAEKPFFLPDEARLVVHQSEEADFEGMFYECDLYIVHVEKQGDVFYKVCKLRYSNAVVRVWFWEAFGEAFLVWHAEGYGLP